ncbi:MAG: low molecular weight phosphotyrosine protein phosphatase [Prolixibacteraceae bacterium]|nr:low molecular weight phosphotyrosine protein phosphatase [Prolixibacteraceae bacterium]
MKQTHSILFICMGNICRSPAAEGIMKHKVQEQGLEHFFYIDSAGMHGWHEGELPDSRMRTHALRRGYALISHSRPIQYRDFEKFDLIIGMDDSNIQDLKRMAPNSASLQKIRRMTDFCRTHKADCVPDPYYGGASGFELVLDLLEDACDGLLDKLKK